MREITSIFLVLLLTGCVVIPVPVPSSRTFSEDQTKFLVIGQTRYDEVLEELGVPDTEFRADDVPACFLLSDDEVATASEYEGKDWTLCMAVAVGGGYQGAGGVGCDPIGESVLRLGFDEHSILMGYAVLRPEGGCRGSTCPPVIANRSDNEEQWKDFYRNKVKQVANSKSLVALCRAAEGGHAEARLELGRIWRNGLYGVSENPINAYVWYCLSNFQGSNFQPPLTLRTQLSDTQIIEARKKIRGIKAGQCKREVMSHRHLGTP